MTEYSYKDRSPDNRFNRNPLLDLGIGADGLKTGHTSEAGYGLVGSAKQGDRRIIFAITGLPSDKARAEEAERIVGWAFRQFSEKTVAKSGTRIAEAEVHLGDADSVGLVPAEDVKLLVPALVKLGATIPAAHMFAFYFAILSAITPPVALAVFAAAGLAKSDLWATGLAAMRAAAPAYGFAGGFNTFVTTTTASTSHVVDLNGVAFQRDDVYGIMRAIRNSGSGARVTHLVCNSWALEKMSLWFEDSIRRVQVALGVPRETRAGPVDGNDQPVADNFEAHVPLGLRHNRATQRAQRAIVELHDQRGGVRDLEHLRVLQQALRFISGGDVGPVAHGGGGPRDAADFAREEPRQVQHVRRLLDELPAGLRGPLPHPLDERVPAEVVAGQPVLGQLPLDHVRAAAAAGWLRHVGFSSCSGEQTVFGIPWIDMHLPLAGTTGTPNGTLLGAAEVADIVEAAGEVTYGLKIGLRPVDRSAAEKLAGLDENAAVILGAMA